MINILRDLKLPDAKIVDRLCEQYQMPRAQIQQCLYFIYISIIICRIPVAFFRVPSDLSRPSRMYFSNQLYVIPFHAPLQDTISDSWNAPSPALNTEPFLLPSVLLMLWTGWKLLSYIQAPTPTPKWKDCLFPSK